MADSADKPHKALSDEQILANLRVFKPVDKNSEKNVWAFWDRGLDVAPDWNQRNIVSWVRRSDPSWVIRVVDMVDGSPTHYSKYLADDSLFPDAFRNRTMTGEHVGQHSSDLIRLPLLYLHGGVWIDVGFMLFRSLDSLCWDVLANPADPRELAAFAISMGPKVGMVFNGFLAARKGCVCVEYWHNTFLEVWRHTKGTAGMHKHPLLRHLPRYEPPSLNNKMPPFKYDQFVDYIAQVFCLERLRHLTDRSSGWDGPQYFATRVLLFDCTTEVYWAQRLTNWDGKKQFELLGRQREGVAKQDEDYKEAEEFVFAILATSATMKVSHGLAATGRQYLAEFWDLEENRDADRQPGTFAAYLRWASENIEQDRQLKPVLLPVIEPALLEGALLEAIGSPRSD